MPNTTTAASASIVGVPSGYIPSEYPKAVHSADGKTALARNPGHLTELEAQGWTEEYIAPKVHVIADPVVQGVATTELSKANSTIRQLTAELIQSVTKHAAEIAEHVDLHGALKAELDLVKQEFADFKSKATEVAVDAVSAPVVPDATVAPVAPAAPKAPIKPPLSPTPAPSPTSKK